MCPTNIRKGDTEQSVSVGGESQVTQLDYRMNLLDYRINLRRGSI